MLRFVLLTVIFALAGCSRQREIERLEWTVMGTVAAVQWRSCEVSALEGRRIADRVRRVFREVETLLNRFDPRSELCRLQTLSDAEVLERCSPLVRPCYEAAFRMRDESGGAFDPRWRGSGTLDLGAIAKGFAVDLAAQAAQGPCLIDLGGNLKAVGGEWRTAVAFSGQRTVLRGGMAAATSAEYFRGRHIYDARTGGRSGGDGTAVTVIHPDSAMMADALSTALFILGKDRGEEFREKFHPEAEVVWIKAPSVKANGDLSAP